MCLNKVVFLLSIFIGAVVAQFHYDVIDLPGQCPRISFITNLDLPRIIGWYYRPHTNINYPLCFNNGGQTMFAIPINATAFDLAFCCQSAANPQISICGPEVGSGLLTTTSRRGEFLYRNRGKIYPTYVLDTDYDTFAIFYGCKPYVPPTPPTAPPVFTPRRNNGRDETIFIYSRFYALTPVAMSRTRHFLADNHIDWNNVHWITQGNSVPYVPHQRPCN